MAQKSASRRLALAASPDALPACWAAWAGGCWLPSSVTLTRQTGQVAFCSSHLVRPAVGDREGGRDTLMGLMHRGGLEAHASQLALPG